MTVTGVELDAQYRALKEDAGLLTGVERAYLDVDGGEGAEFLQGQLTNDIEALEPGEGCYAALLDRKGKIRADMRVLRPAPDRVLIDTDPAARALLLKHLNMYRIGRDAEVTDHSGERSLLSVLGPRAEALVLDGPLSPENAHRELRVDGHDALAVRTDSGIDLIVASADAEAVAAELRRRGAEPVEEAAVEILRVEAGRPRLGHELVEGVMPQEAGINERAVNLQKGCYVGQETVARLHYKGKPNRFLRLLIPEAPVEEGTPVVLGDRELGTVGTAVVSPARGPLALAILRREAEPGSVVDVGGTTAQVAEAGT